MELPVGAQIIRVQDQGGFFWMWAVVDTSMPMETRHFRSFKTGAKIPDDFDTSHYIGFCAVFVQMELGLYIFEEKMPVPVVVDTTQHLSKSDIIRAAGILNDIPVIDIKLSKYDPEDFRSWPDVLENSQGERSFNWSKMLCQVAGFNVYNRPKRRLSQNQIDEIEAQGGFEEEEA